MFLSSEESDTSTCKHILHYIWFYWPGKEKYLRNIEHNKIFHAGFSKKVNKTKTVIVGEGYFTLAIRGGVTGGPRHLTMGP